VACYAAHPRHSRLATCIRNAVLCHGNAIHAFVIQYSLIMPSRNVSKSDEISDAGIN
jgi:hypothetical protein